MLSGENVFKIESEQHIGRCIIVWWSFCDVTIIEMQVIARDGSIVSNIVIKSWNVAIPVHFWIKGKTS